MAAQRTLSWRQAEKMAEKCVRNIFWSKGNRLTVSSTFQHRPRQVLNSQPLHRLQAASNLYLRASVFLQIYILPSQRVSPKTLAAVLECPVEAAHNEVRPHYPRQSISEPSSSSELLKTDDLNIYMAACAEFGRGLAAGRTEERLLAIVTRWRLMDQENRDK